jgi:hypothetical protein
LAKPITVGRGGWLQDQHDSDINDMFFFAGDEIAQELGVQRNAIGMWSEADAAAILTECEQRIVTEGLPLKIG